MFFVQHFIFSPANFKVDMSDTWTGQKPYLAQGVNFKPSIVFSLTIANMDQLLPTTTYGPLMDHRKYGTTLTYGPSHGHPG